MKAEEDTFGSSFTMRQPCQKCQSTSGTISHRNGQACVFCDDCGAWVYNAPRAETGKERRSTRSRPDIAPSAKARVLAAHNGQCIACGKSQLTHGVVMHIDHLIPVEAAKRVGVYDQLIESEWNLAPLCEECNAGKQADLNAVSVTLMYRVLMMKAMPRTDGVSQ